MMVAGLPAVTLVDTAHPWVEANFKETDLADMRVGQRAEISFDAYPGLTVRGHVLTIGAGTGSEFRSEEHTSELQSLMRISYAVFCLKKKTRKTNGSHKGSNTHHLCNRRREHHIY